MMPPQLCNWQHHNIQEKVPALLGSISHVQFAFYIHESETTVLTNLRLEHLKSIVQGYALEEAGSGNGAGTQNSALCYRMWPSQEASKLLHQVHSVLT